MQTLLHESSMDPWSIGHLLMHEAITLLLGTIAAYLADADGTKLYDHVPEGDIAWPTRLHRLVAEITTLQPDIICLQEVEFDAFDRDFVPALQREG
jgi:hypothetical protein